MTTTAKATTLAKVGGREGGGGAPRGSGARRPTGDVADDLATSGTAERWYLAHAIVDPTVLASHPVPEEAMGGAFARSIYRAVLADARRCGAVDLYRVAQALRAQGYNAPDGPLLDTIAPWMEPAHGDLPWPPIEAAADALLSLANRDRRISQLLGELEALR